MTTRKLRVLVPGDKLGVRDVRATLVSHRGSHGDFAECARVSQEILRVLRTGSRWGDLTDPQVEAIQMIAHKLHRIVCGDPSVVDHWHDIAGYAVLAERCTGDESE